MSRLMETPSGLKFGLMPTIIGSVAILYFWREVLIPLAVAVLLAFVLAPAVGWLERRRVGRIAAVLIAVGTSLTVLGAIGWIVEQQFVEMAQKLPDYRENIQKKFRQLKGAGGGSLAKAAKGVEDTFKSLAGTQPSTAPSAALGAGPRTQAPDSHPGESALPRVSPQNPPPVREYSERRTLGQVANHAAFVKDQGVVGIIVEVGEEILVPAEALVMFDMAELAAPLGESVEPHQRPRQAEFHIVIDGQRHLGQAVAAHPVAPGRQGVGLCEPRGLLKHVGQVEIRLHDFVGTRCLRQEYAESCGVAPLHLFRKCRQAARVGNFVDILKHQHQAPNLLVVHLAQKSVERVRRQVVRSGRLVALQQFGHKRSINARKNPPRVENPRHLPSPI